MPRKYTPFSGGWSSSLQREVEAIKLPSELMCTICKQPCPQETFSKNQLIALRSAVASKGYEFLNQQDIAKCTPCASSVICERKCHFCGRFQGIDDFSRNQRTREHPICFRCMNFSHADEVGTLEAAIDSAPPRDSATDDTHSRTQSLLEESTDYDDNKSMALVLQGSNRSVQATETGTAYSERSKENHTGKPGFARIKAYKPPKEERAPVPEPEWSHSQGMEQDMDDALETSMKAFDYL
ncbi:uncharacterized protein PFLUO_LOCUS2415 [Penicillium psychrofluorescens]|uniref:uncharacterized protein n=1 Tax=Penicillium psychrofluorescens TaxID=3158075 RepID=UPI003CCD00C7